MSCHWLHGMGPRYLCHCYKVIMIAMIFGIFDAWFYCFYLYPCLGLLMERCFGPILSSRLGLGQLWIVIHLVFFDHRTSSKSWSSAYPSWTSPSLQCCLFSLFFSGLLGWVGGASESPCLVRFCSFFILFNSNIHLIQLNNSYFPTQWFI